MYNFANLQRHRPKTGICAFFFISLWFASPLFYEEDKSICISIEKRIENHLQSIKEGLDLLEEGTEKLKGL